MCNTRRRTNKPRKTQEPTRRSINNAITALYVIAITALWCNLLQCVLVDLSNTVSHRHRVCGYSTFTVRVAVHVHGTCHRTRTNVMTQTVGWCACVVAAFHSLPATRLQRDTSSLCSMHANHTCPCQLLSRSPRARGLGIPYTRSC